MALVQRVPYIIPAGGILANALTGRGIEFIGKASLLDLQGVADVAGDSMSMDYTVGGDSKVMVPAGSVLNGAAAAGEGPKANEDVIFTDYPIPAGAHLTIGVVGVAAHTGRFGIAVRP